MPLPALARERVHRTLVLPALDEVDAVPGLAALAREVLDVVDRVVLLDGGSTDGTPAAARSAGLEVVDAGSRAPGRPVLGKGDSLWRVADLDTDVLVFRDADVRGVGRDDLDALATAVEADGIALAKGSFTRLQYDNGPPRPVSGRITAFVARPLLALVAPEVAHVPEPLSGQFAIRADVLAGLPVVTRYGVDVGLVLDVAERYGPAAIADVDVGSLTHRAKADASLVPMAHDVAATILGRRGPSRPASGEVAGPGTSSGASSGTSSGASSATSPGASSGADRVGQPGAAADGGTWLAAAGPDGPLLVRPPRRARAHATTADPAGGDRA